MAWTPIQLSMQFLGKCTPPVQSTVSCAYLATSQQITTTLATTGRGRVASVAFDNLSPIQGSVMYYDTITFHASGLTHEAGNLTFSPAPPAHRAAPSPGAAPLPPDASVLYYETFPDVPGVTISNPPGEMCGSATYNITGGYGAYATARGAIPAIGCIVPNGAGSFDGSFVVTVAGWMP